MSRNNRRNRVSTTQTEVPNIETPVPPAETPPEVSLETTGDDSVEETEFEVEFEEAVASDTPVTEAKPKRKARTGPRKVSPEERQILVAVADLHKDDDAWDAKVTFAELPENIRLMLLPSSKPTVFTRGLLLVETDESGAIKNVSLTEVGFEFSGPDLPETVTAKGKAKSEATGAPRGNQSELTAKIDKPHIKLVKLTNENPRQANSHGFYGWQLYVDGMTYREYLKAPYDKDQIVGSGVTHYGPIPGQVKWDVEHGFIAFYDETKPQFLDENQEQENPEYWVVKYPLKERVVATPAETKPKGKRGKAKAAETAAVMTSEGVEVEIPEEVTTETTEQSAA